MNPFNAKFTFINSRYSILNESSVTIGPVILQTIDIPKQLCSTKVITRVLWPLYLDASNNAVLHDVSGCPLTYTELTDAFGSPIHFTDIDKKTIFTILMPLNNRREVMVANSTKIAIVGPLLPVSAIYSGDGVEFYISCIDGVYGNPNPNKINFKKPTITDIAGPACVQQFEQVKENTIIKDIDVAGPACVQCEVKAATQLTKVCDYTESIEIKTKCAIITITPRGNLT